MFFIVSTYLSAFIVCFCVFFRFFFGRLSVPIATLPSCSFQLFYLYVCFCIDEEINDDMIMTVAGAIITSYDIKEK